MNYWKGMPDALSDTHHLFFASTIANTSYYTGAMTSSYNSNNNGSIFPYLNEYVWENVRNCYILLERIDENPELSDAEKNRMKDEARCILASTYFVCFRFYGGLPIIEATFSGADAEYELPRASVDETVKFMVGILDSVIKNNNLPWSYLGTTSAAQETGRWTIAAAVALKAKILQFAASLLRHLRQCVPPGCAAYRPGRFGYADEGVLCESFCLSGYH